MGKRREEILKIAVDEASKMIEKSAGSFEIGAEGDSNLISTTKHKNSSKTKHKMAAIHPVDYSKEATIILDDEENYYSERMPRMLHNRRAKDKDKGAKWSHQ